MLLAAGGIQTPEKGEDDSEDEADVIAKERANRITYGFTKYSDDEDSDFD